MPERESACEPFTRIPDELKAFTQWVNWRQDDEHKVPVNPATLGNAGVGWENTWASYGQALATARVAGLGLGFVLTADDPYTVIDLDDCVDEKGRVSQRTRAILDLLLGWTELSPSETGLHIWVRNEVPVNRRTTGIEIYSSARWMTVTGRSNPHCALAIPERTDEVVELVARFLPEPEGPTFTPTPTPSSDLEIWERLFGSERGDVYRRLYEGDISASNGDHSLAVIMLANQLALLTDFDVPRMKRLLYESNLVRPKWDERRGNNMSWIDYQIQDAIAYVSGRKR